MEPLTAYYATHYAQAFTIPSGAMQPTLLVGDYILVDRSAYRIRAPQRGDIVVFPYPRNERRDFIKRIIGMPGDTVVVRGQQVLVNGQTLVSFVGFVGYPEHYPGDGLGIVAGDGAGVYPLGVFSCLGQQTTRIFGPPNLTAWP